MSDVPAPAARPPRFSVFTKILFIILLILWVVYFMPRLWLEQNPPPREEGRGLAIPPFRAEPSKKPGVPSAWEGLETKLRALRQDIADLGAVSWAGDFRYRLDRAEKLLNEALARAPAAAPGAEHGRALDKLREDLDTVRTGRSLFKPGARLLLAHRSRLDDTGQPWHLALPNDYDETADRHWPMVVYLHGQGMYAPLQGSPRPTPGWIAVSPHGRGGMDYQWVGEVDVLEVVAAACARLKVDPGRIVLAGASMGGSGAWHLGSRFPDRWAGLIPVCGITSVRPWWGPYGSATPDHAPQRAIRDALRDDTAALAYADNLAHQKILALHGDRDPINLAENAELMQNRLARLGAAGATFWRYPFLKHGMDADYAALLDEGVFATPPPPARIRHITAWLRYGRTHGLRITGLKRYGQPGRVEAGLQGPAAGSVLPVRLNVVTEGVRALRLFPRQWFASGKAGDIDPKAMAQQMLLRLDDREVPSESWTKAYRATAPEEAADRRNEPVLDFHRNGDGDWLPGLRPPARPSPTKSATEPTRPSLRKTFALEGPVEHAFMDRFILVAPDAPAPDDTSPEASRARAARAAEETCARWWHTRFHVWPLRRTASAVTPDDARASHLILFGDGDVNGVTARVAGFLPVRRGPAAAEGGGTSSIELDGRAYTGTHPGFIVVYPNPEAPDRYVVVYAGATPEAYEDVVTRFGNWFDWVPYYHRPHYDYALFDDRTTGRDPETFLVWGFFGPDWEVHPATRYEGDPSWREAVLPRGHRHPSAWEREPSPDPLAPNPATPPETPAASVAAGPAVVDEVGDGTSPSTAWLDTRPELGRRLPREQIERNRFFDGQPLRLGDRVFERGLAVRYDATVIYDVRGWERFTAVAGATPENRPRFGPPPPPSEPDRVTVKVRGRKDADASWQPLFEGKHEPGTPGLPLSVPLSGIGELSLEVAGGMAWWHGTFVWGAARLHAGEPHTGSE